MIDHEESIIHHRFHQLMMGPQSAIAERTSKGQGILSQCQEDILPYVEGYPSDIGNDEESSLISLIGVNTPHVEDGGSRSCPHMSLI